jgi:hypothetical protein
MREQRFTTGNLEAVIARTPGLVAILTAKDVRARIRSASSRR